MHLVVLDDVADLAGTDAALEAHGERLHEHYAAGTFLASGRREPHTGSMILAGGDREAAVAADPFAVRGLAKHTVIEFHPSRFGGALDTAEVRNSRVTNRSRPLGQGPTTTAWA